MHDLDDLTRDERAIYRSVSRRGFMGATAAATLAALAGSEPLLRASSSAPPKTTADAVIVLWMAGGMAQTETFDPKRYTPFAPGVRADQVLSTFPAIDTAVDDIKFTAGLEQIAQVIDRGSVLRGFTAADLGFILHARHQYHWHTGYVPPQPMAMPHIGSVISRTLGPRNPDMPAFVAIGQTVEGEGEIGTLKAFHTAGFLGAEHGPFLIVDPRDAASAVKPPQSVTETRFRSRRQLYQALLAQDPVHREGSEFQRESLVRSLDAADRLLASPAAKAFDVSLEPPASRDAYGPSRFGRGCLLARRLIEGGARYVEVTSEYIPFVHWDTHEHGHEHATDMKAMIDAPVATLIRDLETRGLLDRTLVVLASEFGRDAVTEGKVGKEVKDQAINMPDVMSDIRHYGMHRHFTAAGSLLMFGGGVKKGFVFGETDDFGYNIAKDGVHVHDFHATMLHLLGVDHKKMIYRHEGRDYRLTDVAGEIVKPILA